MSKHIAVVITGNQDEALRMSVGLTLADDEVDIFFLDKKIKRNKDSDLNIVTGKELGINFYSTCENNEVVDKISANALAGKLLTYDHILPY